MKIAVVAPSPVPFVIGGMENLAWGLCDSINKYTKHQAELIKLPSREHSFWDLIDTYYEYYKLDLSYYDCVITTKYPSWMVQHSNSICYMVHTLRGLYDTYHLMNKPMEVESSNSLVNDLLEYMRKNPNPNNLDVFFSKVLKIKEQANKMPQALFEFPGPFIRVLVHYMDQWALSRTTVKEICAISNTIKNRSEYYPKGANVRVIYPPSNIKGKSCNGYDYIFMISRLDAPKRIDLLIQAMEYVEGDTQLLIAGTGPDEKRLKELAKNDSRIKFLGFVSDDEVEKLYSNCLFVPYFPYDEDYGYITYEAMMHRKAVLTTYDAGGPTEFVEDGKTGYVVSAKPQHIAEKMNYFIQNTGEAERMGENAYKLVSEINWERVVKELFKIEGIDMNTNKKRKKITVTSTFPIYPPQGGGQARIFNLYKNVAKEFDVEIVSFTNSDQKAFDGEIAPGLRERRIPKTQRHQDKEWELEQKAGLSISDIAMISIAGETPEYGRCLREAMENSDIVVASHPYLYNEIKKFLKDQILIYEAHNVESKMKDDMLALSKYKKQFVQEVFDIEKACCQDSAFIMTCSEEDKKTLYELYGVSTDKMLTVPNGVDVKATHFTSLNERVSNKNKLGLGSECLGLFMGSWHKPNLEACQLIFDMAERCPDVKFLLMGSQCMYFEQNKTRIPENVGLLGLVDEDTKNRIFSVVDFALNPMLSGSGTNLKMFDYMSAGIPIISTEFGTRGIENKEGFIVADIKEFQDAINEFSLENCLKQIEDNREYAEATFDWEAIAKPLLEKIKGIN